MKAVFASTNQSCLGLDSESTVELGNPILTGFAPGSLISAYAHRKLESEIGFDILALVDGELQNVPEQDIEVVTPEWRKPAVFVMSE